MHGTGLIDQKAKNERLWVLGREKDARGEKGVLNAFSGTMHVKVTIQSIWLGQMEPHNRFLPVEWLGQLPLDIRAPCVVAIHHNHDFRQGKNLSILSLAVRTRGRRRMTVQYGTVDSAGTTVIGLNRAFSAFPMKITLQTPERERLASRLTPQPRSQSTFSSLHNSLDRDGESITIIVRLTNFGETPEVT